MNGRKPNILCIQWNFLQSTVDTDVLHGTLRRAPNAFRLNISRNSRALPPEVISGNTGREDERRCKHRKEKLP